MRRALIVIAGIITPLIVVFGAEAATVLALTVEELAEKSDRVVRARTVSRLVEADSRTGLIFTLTTLEVLEDLRGEGPRQLVVRQLGGESELQGLRIPGDAALALGEEVVLFVTSGRDSPLHVHLVGLSLGKFSIAREGGVPVALRRVDGLHLLRPDGKMPRLEERLPLDVLRDRVRGTGINRLHEDRGGGSQ